MAVVPKHYNSKGSAPVNKIYSAAALELVPYARVHGDMLRSRRDAEAKLAVTLQLEAESVALQLPSQCGAEDTPQVPAAGYGAAFVADGAQRCGGHEALGFQRYKFGPR